MKSNRLSFRLMINRRVLVNILRALLAVTIYLVIFACSGCTHDMSRKEIDEIDLILVLGMDYSDGEYSLSGIYSTGGGSDPEKGTGEGTEEIAKGKGITPFAALEDLKLKNKKSISLAQTGSFLLGEDAAKNGLKECLDFLSREETIKMEALIYVIKEQSAADFIQEAIGKEQIIHEDLEAIEQKQRENLTRNDNTVVNILNDMKQSYSSVLLPYLISEESGYKIEGYAVFDQLKLYDYLDSETSDGVNFFRNIMRSYPIYLKDEAGLLISYTNTKLKAKLQDQQVKIIVKVNFETAMKEVLTDNNVFTSDELSRLTEEQNNYIRAILEKPVKYVSDHGLDILGLARLIENQNFTQWNSIEKNWREVIPDISFQYELKSRISKSFILGNVKE